MQGAHPAGGSPVPPAGVLNFMQQHKQKLATCAGALVAAYLGYKAYQSSAQLGKVKASIQEWLSTLSALGNSANIVARDLHTFLTSDEDELPRSLRQLNKLLQSPEVQSTVSSTATSLAQSITHLVASANASGRSSPGEPVLNTLIEAVLSDRGRSLVGMAVGLATKNATSAFCEFLERMQHQQAPAGPPDEQGGSPAAVQGPTSSPHLNLMLSLLASEQGERVLSLLITKSIKTAVSTYIDATTGYNVYEDIVASIAKQEHRDAVSDVMSRVTAAFCRELAAAYRRASARQQQQQHANQQQQQGAVQTAAALSCSSASSSSNSVISLAGHIQNAHGDSSHPCKPAVGRRHSQDELSAAATAGLTAEPLQPRLSNGSTQGSATPTSAGAGLQGTMHGLLACPPAGPGGARYSLHGVNSKANAPRAALNALMAAAAGNSSSTLQPGAPAAMDMSSSMVWWRPLVDLAKEQHVRSLTLDVVRSAAREATRSTWESLFSSSSSQGLSGLVFGASPQQQAWATYRAYALLTVLISLFMYAVSPRVIAV